MFVLFMLPQQWYYGWSSQKAVRKARAHFNGCLAWATTLAGQYMVNHPELSPQDHPAFITPGITQLSWTGNIIFLADIQSAIHRADPGYKQPSLSQVHTHMLNNSKLQEAQAPSRSVSLHP